MFSFSRLMDCHFLAVSVNFDPKWNIENLALNVNVSILDLVLGSVLDPVLGSSPLLALCRDCEWWLARYF